jgi:hypothetical protein
MFRAPSARARSATRLRRAPSAFGAFPRLAEEGTRKNGTTISGRLTRLEDFRFDAADYAPAAPIRPAGFAMWDDGRFGGADWAQP